MVDKPTQLDILRHGRCEGGEIFRGSTDVPLSTEGWSQMRASANGFATRWDLIVCSPLQRCYQFAQALADETGTPLQVHDDLREMHFGDWEGRLIAETWTEDEARMKLWSHNPAINPPPNGEPLAEVSARVSPLIETLLAQHAGKNILLVTHGGVVRVLLAYCLGMAIEHANRFDVPYACASRLANFPFYERWRLVSHNPFNSLGGSQA